MKFDHLPFEAEELLFDPPDLRRMLAAVPELEADQVVAELQQQGLCAGGHRHRD